jgi:hypothetical protein
LMRSAGPFSAGAPQHRFETRLRKERRAGILCLGDAVGEQIDRFTRSQGKAAQH